MTGWPKCCATEEGVASCPSEGVSIPDCDRSLPIDGTDGAADSTATGNANNNGVTIGDDTETFPPPGSSVWYVL